MLVALASVKGSPGVTTTGLALAAAWPAARRLLIEADPAGGDLATRLNLPPAPGLMGLAAAARHDIGPDAVWRHAHHLGGGLHVLTAPAGGEQASACLAALAATPVLARFADGREPVVIADCGRLDPGTPALPLARHAQLTVLLARPHLGDLAHLAQRIPGLAGAGLELAVLLAASPRRLPSEATYPAPEVAATLGIPVLGQLPADEHGVALLNRSPAGLPRGGRLVPLLRTARGLAGTLAARPPRGVATARPQTPPAIGVLDAREVAEVSSDSAR